MQPRKPCTRCGKFPRLGSDNWCSQCRQAYAKKLRARHTEQIRRMRAQYAASA